MDLAERIESRAARVVVVGGGYVGLPLAKAIRDARFPVIVYDTNRTRVEQLHDTIAATDEPVPALTTADVIVICVPTPLGSAREPDTGLVMAALKIVRVCGKGIGLVILESTVYPGFTRTEMASELPSSAHIAFSPERTDPGNERFGLANTPKLVGGMTAESAELARLFYSSFVDHVVVVSSPDVAELAKCHENTFRQVNIALANELAQMCHRLQLDAWEVIDAAATKPFGFMPFYPGPGPGGHCIPIDPLYLSHKMWQEGFHASMIDAADRVNRTMPEYVVARAAEALNTNSRSVRQSHVVLIGVAYKSGVSDTRESPALDVWRLLEEQGAHVRYFDPHVPRVSILRESLPAGSVLATHVARADLVILLTDHSDVDCDTILADAPLVLDCRNAMSKKSPRIIPL